MWLFRYTNEGAAGVRSGGFVARREILRSGVEAAGGHIVEFSMIHGDDTWDAVMICEYPERPRAAGLVAADFMARGAGTIAAERIAELVSPEDADAANAEFSGTWRPAGE